MPYSHKKEAEIFEAFDRHAATREAKNIFEATPSSEVAVSDFADQQIKSAAMALVLSWLEMGEYSYSAIEGGAVVMADMDENETIDENEQVYLNDLLQATADVFIAAGAEPANVADFLDNESDEAGALLGEFLSAKVENVTLSDEDIIVNYATSGELILESFQKVLRDGKVALKKKRVGPRPKLSSAQKAGLKKARSKAFSGAALKKRKLSMRKREKLGL